MDLQRPVERYPYYNPYYDLADLKDYELFIGPRGEYYKVKTTYESDHDYTHYKWALGYLTEKKLAHILEREDMKKFTPLQVLIHYFGFVRYTHCGVKKPLLNVPKPEFFGVKLKEVQVEAIRKLLKYNGEVITDEIAMQLCYDGTRYDDKREHVFNRMVGRRR